MKSGVSFILLLIISPIIILADTQGDLDREIEINYNLKLASKLFNSREIPGHLELSHRYYLNAFRLSDNKEKIYWALARSCWYQGEVALSKEKALNFYNKTINYAKKSVVVNPNDYRSHRWYAIGMGSFALKKGIMETINLKGKIKSGLEKALSLNPNDISSILALAHWYFYLPPVFGGDKKEAFKYLDLAQRVAPTYTRVLMARTKFLISEDKKLDALKSLHRVLKIKKSIDNSAAIEDHYLAKELIKVLSNKN